MKEQQMTSPQLMRLHWTHPTLGDIDEVVCPGHNVEVRMALAVLGIGSFSSDGSADVDGFDGPGEMPVCLRCCRVEAEREAEVWWPALASMRQQWQQGCESCPEEYDEEAIFIPVDDVFDVIDEVLNLPERMGRRRTCEAIAEHVKARCPRSGDAYKAASNRRKPAVNGKLEAEPNGTPASTPVDPGWDQLIDTAGLAIAARHGFHAMSVGGGCDAEAAVGALAPLLAARDKRKLREGRNRAAEAIEAYRDFMPAVGDWSWRLEMTRAAGLARGGSTDEERNDEQ